MATLNSDPTIPYIKNEWADSMEISTTKLNKIENQLELVTDYLSSIAPEYQRGQAYEIGDYCIYNAQLWQCNTRMTADQNSTWDQSKWTEKTISSLVGEITGIIPLNKGGTGQNFATKEDFQLYFGFPTDYLYRDADDRKTSVLELSALRIIPNSTTNAQFFFHILNDQNASVTGGYLSYDSTNKNLQFGQYIDPGAANKHRELYCLPLPQEDWSNGDTVKPYWILTNRDAVTIAQGGTGATDAATARTNLGIGITNITSNITAANDTAVVHKTTSETISGMKTFSNTSGTIIYNKLIIEKYTSSTNPEIYFRHNTAGTLSSGTYYNGYIQIDAGITKYQTTNQFGFYEYAPYSTDSETNTGKTEGYLLPAPTKDLSTSVTYNIHTDKLFTGQFQLIYSDSNSKATILPANTSGLKFLSMNGSAAPQWMAAPNSVNDAWNNIYATNGNIGTLTSTTGNITTVNATTLQGKLVGSIANSTYIGSTGIVAATDWNTLTDTGLYRTDAGNSFSGTGAPTTYVSDTYHYGVLQVLRTGAKAAVQIYYPHTTNNNTGLKYSIHYRTGYAVADTTNTAQWQNWRILLDNTNYTQYTYSKAQIYGLGNNLSGNYTTLDNVVNPGLYYSPNATAAGNIANSPIIASYMLLNYISIHEDYRYQIAIASATNPTMFIRGKDDTQWTSWNQILDSNHVGLGLYSKPWTRTVGEHFIVANGDQNMVSIMYPSGGQKRLTSTATGYMLITIGNTALSTSRWYKIKVSVNIYDASNYKAVDYWLTGYAYGNSYWRSITAVAIGHYNNAFINLPVCFTDNTTRRVIAIGTDTTIWPGYSSINITNVEIAANVTTSNDTVEDVARDWSITFSTSLPTKLYDRQTITTTKVLGAYTASSSNDYAEFRNSAYTIQPGYVVQDNDNGALTKTTERLTPGAQIVSDTYGYALGKSNSTNIPIAVSGRVLVYTYRDRSEYHTGQCVCSAPDGTVDIMTREEIQQYPDCIVGIVSEIPDYDVWGEDEQIPVNNRIWIKVK